MLQAACLMGVLLRILSMEELRAGIGVWHRRGAQSIDMETEPWNCPAMLPQPSPERTEQGNGFEGRLKKNIMYQVKLQNKEKFIYCPPFVLPPVFEFGAISL